MRAGALLHWWTGAPLGCAAAAGTGATCGRFPRSCAPGLACVTSDDGTTATCMPPAKLGDPCARRFFLCGAAHTRTSLAISSATKPSRHDLRAPPSTGPCSVVDRMKHLRSSHKLLRCHKSGRVGLGSRRVHHASFLPVGFDPCGLWKQLLRARLRAVAWGVHSEVRADRFPVRHPCCPSPALTFSWLDPFTACPADACLGARGRRRGFAARWLLCRFAGALTKSARWQALRQGWWREGGTDIRAVLRLGPVSPQDGPRRKLGRWILRQGRGARLRLGDGIPAVFPPFAGPHGRCKPRCLRVQGRGLLAWLGSEHVHRLVLLLAFALRLNRVANCHGLFGWLARCDLGLDVFGFAPSWMVI